VPCPELEQGFSDEDDSGGAEERCSCAISGPPTLRDAEDDELHRERAVDRGQPPVFRDLGARCDDHERSPDRRDEQSGREKCAPPSFQACRPKRERERVSEEMRSIEVSEMAGDETLDLPTEHGVTPQREVPLKAVDRKGQESERRGEPGDSPRRKSHSNHALVSRRLRDKP
jgi:hypothetical protein